VLLIDLITPLSTKSNSSPVYQLFSLSRAEPRKPNCSLFGRVPSVRTLSSAHTLPSARIGLMDPKAKAASLHATWAFSFCRVMTCDTSPAATFSTSIARM